MSTGRSQSYKSTYFINKLQRSDRISKTRGSIENITCQIILVPFGSTFSPDAVPNVVNSTFTIINIIENLEYTYNKIDDQTRIRVCILTILGHDNNWIDKIKIMVESKFLNYAIIGRKTSETGYKQLQCYFQT